MLIILFKKIKLLALARKIFSIAIINWLIINLLLPNIIIAIDINTLNISYYFLIFYLDD